MGDRKRSTKGKFGVLKDKKEPSFLGEGCGCEECYSSSSSFLILTIPRREIKKRTPLMTAAVTKT